MDTMAGAIGAAKPYPAMVRDLQGEQQARQRVGERQLGPSAGQVAALDELRLHAKKGEPVEDLYHN
jgi:hypothetical protein